MSASGRIAHVIPQPNPEILRVHPDPELAPVMGRFTPARYNGAHHAYDIPARLADEFASFCRIHSIVLVAEPRTVVTHIRNTPETERILAESRERLTRPEEQAEVNRRGLAKVREALAGKPWAREWVERLEPLGMPPGEEDEWPP